MDAELLCRNGAKVVGVDISPDALRGAQERARRYGVDYDLSRLILKHYVSVIAHLI